MTKFDIKVISDNVCPFCYIGLSRLNRAISIYKKTVSSTDTFTISWSAYALDPTAPKIGIPLSQRMAQRFGPDKYESMRGHLARMGLPEGIHFSMNSKTGNTRDSHRLVQFAKTKNARGADGSVDTEVENRVVTEIMRSYFELDGDITSKDMLVDAAGRAGLDKGEAKKWLDGDDGGKEVDREIGEAYDMGIRGVPHFIINGKFHVDGAQDVSEFLGQFSKVKAAGA